MDMLYHLLKNINENTNKGNNYKQMKNIEVEARERYVLIEPPKPKENSTSLSKLQI